VINEGGQAGVYARSSEGLSPILEQSSPPPSVEKAWFPFQKDSCSKSGQVTVLRVHCWERGGAPREAHEAGMGSTHLLWTHGSTVQHTLTPLFGQASPLPGAAPDLTEVSPPHPSTQGTLQEGRKVRSCRPLPARPQTSNGEVDNTEVPQSPHTLGTSALPSMTCPRICS
jgi:hypothetical protein